jgi:hypothetical protein
MTLSFAQRNLGYMYDQALRLLANRNRIVR